MIVQKDQKAMSADDQTRLALEEALDDEYKARATYRKVIEAFGPVRPFINIVESEGRHIRALLNQFDRLGLVPPADAWATKVDAPATLLDACNEAVSAEVENAAMYDRLLSKVSDPAVREVLRNLRDASQERHLPAFRRCAARLS